MLSSLHDRPVQRLSLAPHPPRDCVHVYVCVCVCVRLLLQVPIDTNVRAHAFVALGKLCLRDERLAKQSITVLLPHGCLCSHGPVHACVLCSAWSLFQVLLMCSSCVPPCAPHVPLVCFSTLP